jgi:hypothetical protein
MVDGAMRKTGRIITFLAAAVSILILGWLLALTTANPVLAQTISSDDDADGINDLWEDRLQTGKDKRTLFIKPLYKQTATSVPVYWADFKKSYHQSIEGYFNAIFLARAKKPDGTPVGLEIRVIGDDANPYVPMRARTNNVPTYDPAKDSTYADGKPPVNIITIMAKGVPSSRVDSYDVTGASNRGHIQVKKTYQPDPAHPDQWPTVNKTYFVWTWDTKGYTNNMGSAYNWSDPMAAPRPGYHGATVTKPVEVGLHALACYMEEGAYTSLSASDGQACTTNCAATTCCVGKKSTDDYNTNVLADFNEYELDNTGKITAVGRFAISGSEYTRQQVLTHTLVHEIVHALLKASSLDECSNPCCPMSNFVARERGWTLTELGASSCGGSSTFTGRTCTHASGLNDITQKGVVWNVPH